MKNIFNPSILLSGFLMLTCWSIQAQKYEKAIDKMEEDYLYGEYNSAIAAAEKLRDKLLDETGEERQLLPEVILMESKYHLSRGNIPQFYTRLDEGLALAAKEFGSDAPEYADMILEAALLYVDYGHYRLASERLQEATRILEEQQAINDTREGKINFVTAMVLSGQGYYNKAIKYIDEVLPYYATRATDRETVIDKSTGKVESQKLKKKERLNRYREYAALLTQKAFLTQKGGDTHGADTEYGLAENWIDDNLSRKDIAYLRNRYYHWDMLSRYLDKEKDVIKEFSDMIDDMLKRHDRGHAMLLNMYESYLIYLSKHDEVNKFKFAFAEFSESIKRRYSKASVHPMKLSMIEFYATLDGKIKGKQETAARNLLYNSEYIPANYPERLKLLDYLYQVSLYKKAYRSGEEYIREMLDLKLDLYGEQSPEYHFTRLKLANHLLNYDNDIDQAIKIYKESYYEIVEPEIYIQHPDYNELQNNLAAIYEISDDYEKANAALAKSAAAAREKFDKNR